MRWLPLILLLAVSARAESGDEEARFFTERVVPLLEARCLKCHSHAAGKMKGGLTLDSRSGWASGGENGPAILPGQVEESLLIRAIRHVDPELRMPKEKMPAEEIAVLEEWVRHGAADPRVEKAKAEPRDWWSLRALVRPALPVGREGNPIDAFIGAKIQEAGLPTSPEADRRTLIRRVTYDLTGLPPTPEEVTAFQKDPRPTAYEELVNRLLASPRYGEAWARHWMDTIHFADSNGYEHDVGRDFAWRFRDYLISALNGDTPWDRFIREQLATDVFYPEEPRLTPALGFLGAGLLDLSTQGTAPITFDYLDRDDLVTQTMAAFTSTTANCARCHTHKFDPISQEDYYALQAVFAGVQKGDVAYDEEVTVARERRHWQAVSAAVQSKDVGVLLAPENQPAVERWLSHREESATWQTWQPETVESAHGLTLTWADDGVLVASGTRPDTDTYTLRGTSPLGLITAVRLEVVARAGLPMGGPGLQDNGNLHLSEIELSVLEPGSAAPRKLALRRPTADFNQVAWGIERALDGDITTARGIYPEVGKTHTAVFELAEPVHLAEGAKLSCALQQAHGRGHLIGALRLALTGDEAARVAVMPATVVEALKTPEAERTPGMRAEMAAHVLGPVAREALAKLPAQSRVYAAAATIVSGAEPNVQLKTLPEAKVVHLLERGDFNKPGAIVGPGALSALTHLPARFSLPGGSGEAARRAALAEWLAHHDNVLTWRSIVNRVWHYHFGRGICDTPSDLGHMGGLPSHPELLDWLATWFRDDAQGSLKELHRLIVTSATYRQASTEQAAAAKLDAENRLLWRQNPHRLDADAVRDFALAASGSLDLAMGGPGVQQFTQSKGPQATPVLDYTAFSWASPQAHRRSIYRYVWRGIADPFMESLDFPDLGLLAPERGFSSSALQALTLYNNAFVLQQGAALAERVTREATGIDAQVARAVSILWQRLPSEEEQAEFAGYAGKHGLPELCRVLLNSNEFLFVD